MTRLTYQAPGVYVEEIPSARQPIAGVGTNTAAFIGIVADTIYYPVANNNYDPVAARDALKKITVQSPPPTPGAPSETPEAAVARLDGELTNLRATEGTSRNQIRDAERALAAAKALASPAPAAPVAGETEDLTYEDGKPDQGLLTPSTERPYYLKAFNIQVDPTDTKFCTNFTEYTNRFGPFSAFGSGADSSKPLHPGHYALTHAVYGFFKNGGTRCFIARVKSAADLAKALKNFESIDEVALIAAPGPAEKCRIVWNALMDYVEDENRENVFAILDSPSAVGDPNDFDIQKLTTLKPANNPYRGQAKMRPFTFPQIEVVDPAKQLQDIDPSGESRQNTGGGPLSRQAGTWPASMPARTKSAACIRRRRIASCAARSMSSITSASQSRRCSIPRASMSLEP